MLEICLNQNENDSEIDWKSNEQNNFHCFVSCLNHKRIESQPTSNWMNMYIFSQKSEFDSYFIFNWYLINF